MNRYNNIRQRADQTAARDRAQCQPQQYGQSGIHTFLLGSDRVFYERDLGSGTAARAKAIRSFSPDGWKRVADR